MRQKRNIVSSLQFLLNDDDGPLYQQLYQQIIAHILQGRLQPSDRLPGSRALAESLGVSRSTVVNSFERLIAEGILASKSKSGIFVAEDALLLLDQHKSTVRSADSKDDTRQEATEKPVLPLSFNSGIDPTAFPQQAWLKSMRASWRTPDPMVLGDNSPTGLPALKQAIADYLYQLRGLSCQPDQILITAGSRDALTLIHHTLEKINPGVNWLCENPTYPPIRELIRSWKKTGQGNQQLEIDQEGCQIPKKRAETDHKMITAAVLTPNRQYPTGVAMSSSRRQQWLSYLLEEQGWLIEDDYDNEFNYGGKSGIPLMQADRSGRVLFVGSFSKVLFRGLRLGFIVASKALYPRLKQSRHELGASAALPMQPVVAEFMQNGEFARHINRMRRHYRQKRDYLLTLCDQYLCRWFDWQQPQGGMHLLIFLKPELLVDFREPHLTLLNKEGNKPLDFQIANLMRRQNIRMHLISDHYGHNHDWRDDKKGKQANSHEELGGVPQGFVLGFTGPDNQTLQFMIETLAETVTDFFLTDSIKLRYPAR